MSSSYLALSLLEGTGSITLAAPVMSLTLEEMSVVGLLNESPCTLSRGLSTSFLSLQGVRSGIGFMSKNTASFERRSVTFENTIIVQDESRFDATRLMSCDVDEVTQATALY
ncbi:hypothetical protein A0J61_07627 [Choanephora cucurbitarum]|uniref:Uncharacterized protein n=1 Tax=Choanephora cucurbitarum TaxID=101091 RepID=A0A1C7N5C1_9FUNG|nr:hypothetical protein A0J61_07627 [Choanephora cucurbitarum]